MKYSELSEGAQRIWIEVSNTHQIRDTVSDMIDHLVKKSKKQDISLEKLQKSSWFEKICCLGVKEYKKESGKVEITTLDRKDFKNSYAEFMLDEVNSRICNG